MRYTRAMKVSLPAPSRADSPQLKMVSVILPLFITTVMPREMPMMNATPSSSAAPETKAFTVSSSERPQQMPVRMAAPRNRAESSGNHQPSSGRAAPISPKGMTAYTITRKVAAKKSSASLCRPLSFAPSGALPPKWERCSPRSSATRERSGCAFTRPA